MKTFSFTRMWAMFTARNHEFFRDRAAFGWNFLFPFLIVLGFGIIFGDRGYSSFKVGVFAVDGPVAAQSLALPEKFLTTRYLEFIPFADRETALARLRHHKIDFLVEQNNKQNRYWLNDSSPKGYLVERLYLASLIPADSPIQAARQAIHGEQIRYVDWLFPGILAMNMMFSALWGVGYVVVRYRKNGALKRLAATPLTALEYLSAQLLSRIFLLMFTLVVVWVGSDLFFHFKVAGRLVDLLLVYLLGGFSLCALGLVLAARGVSEEFTSGILNFITWPMMFLSEVWFSIEGAPEWLRKCALALPLTHLIRAVRAIMNDGATLWDVRQECFILLGFTLLFLVIGSLLFSWHE